MNYIKLLNQFWILRRGHKMTNLQADLYYFLVQECNARGWENPFRCANGVVCTAIDVSEPALIRARKILIEAGLINYKPGVTKRSSPVYFINAEIEEQEIEFLDDSKEVESIDYLTTLSNNTQKVGENKNNYLTTLSNNSQKESELLRDYLHNSLTTFSNSVNIKDKQNKTKPNITIDKSIVPGLQNFEGDFSEPGTCEVEIRKEERKKNCAQKKKDEKPKAQHWQQMVTVWLDFYEEKYHYRPDFSPIDGSKLRGILLALEKVAAQKNYEWTVGNAQDSFRNFLAAAQADKWLQQHWLLKNIEQNTSAILATMLNPKPQKNNVLTSNANAVAHAKEVARQQRAARDAQQNNTTPQN